MITSAQYSEVTKMLYTLLVLNSKGKPLMELDFSSRLTACDAAIALQRGYSKLGEYTIQVYDNVLHKVILSELTKTQW